VDREVAYAVVAFFCAYGARSCSIVGAALFLDRGVCDIQRLLLGFKRSLGGRHVCVGERDWKALYLQSRH